MTIYTPNSAVKLYVGDDERIGLSRENWDYVKAAHEDAQEALEQAALRVAEAGLDPDSEEYADARDAQIEVIQRHLLVGESIIIDNADDAVDAGYTVHGVGASDLMEALQEAIGGHDQWHIGQPGISSDEEFSPEWVASTHEKLAELAADYYSCEVRELSEVL